MLLDHFREDQLEESASLMLGHQFGHTLEVRDHLCLAVSAKRTLRLSIRLHFSGLLLPRASPSSPEERPGRCVQLFAHVLATEKILLMNRGHLLVAFFCQVKLFLQPAETEVMGGRRGAKPLMSRPTAGHTDQHSKQDESD